MRRHEVTKARRHERTRYPSRVARSAALCGVLLMMIAAGGCKKSSRNVDDAREGIKKKAAAPGPVIHAADLVPGAAEPSPQKPASDKPAADAPLSSEFQAVQDTLGIRGSGRLGVYTFIAERDDMMLQVEGSLLPPQAMQSAFHFFAGCCGGKLSVVGQFIVLDYEANDVIDALRKHRLEVAGMAPMLLHNRERPVVIHFQGHGDPEPLAKALKEALSWTGKQRMAPQPGVLQGPPAP